MTEKQAARVPVHLNSLVRDTVTEFSGVVTATITYLQGDTQHLVEKMKNDGEGIVSEWIRADRLVVIRL